MTSHRTENMQIETDVRFAIMEESKQRKMANFSLKMTKTLIASPYPSHMQGRP